MKRRLLGALAALAMAVATTIVSMVLGATPAHADGCYNWNRSLSTGATGEDVKELQVRVSGYPGSGAVLGIDGSYGPATKDAVSRFQQAYGLAADGVAGPSTFEKIYALQDDDCTPVNFTYAELNGCNSDWSGGAVSATTAKYNARVSMWKMQALRHALGDQSIRVTSGFRSKACNDAVGGASDSRHLYGDAVDMGVSPHSLCTLAQQARNHGFNGILGPGFPDHNDHTHVDHRGSRHWSAPDCGI